MAKKQPPKTGKTVPKTGTAKSKPAPKRKSRKQAGTTMLAPTHGVAFGPAVAQAIIERMTSGLPLKVICEASDMPSPYTVFGWLAKGRAKPAEFPELAAFVESYDMAGVARAELMAVEILDIADTQQIGEIVTEKPTGTEIKRADMIEHRRLQIDARKFLMAKLAPGRFAERVAQAQSSPAPVTVNIDVSMTSADAAEKYQAFIRASRGE